MATGQVREFGKPVIQARAPKVHLVSASGWIPSQVSRIRGCVCTMAACPPRLKVRAKQQLHLHPHQMCADVLQDNIGIPLYGLPSVCGQQAGIHWAAHRHQVHLKQTCNEGNMLTHGNGMQ